MAWALVLCAAMQPGCETCSDTRGRDRADDVSFLYPRGLHPGFVEAIRRVWGKHLHAVALYIPDESGRRSPGIHVTMAAGYTCRRGAVHRFILEAASTLVPSGVPRVACSEADRPDAGVRFAVEVSPYIERVAGALGYDLDTWMEKGFDFQGAAHGPGYLVDRSFPDRFAFIEYLTGPPTPSYHRLRARDLELSYRGEDRTVLVLTTPDCDILGWRSHRFMGDDLSRGADLIYYWVAGGGRFAVCEGPDKRYLLGTPHTLRAIGLDGVQGFWECVIPSPEPRPRSYFGCN